MAAEDPYSASQFAPGASADYMDLFTNSGAWSQVSANLSVFKLYSAFVANATDAQLQQVINWSNANHIALGLETGVLPVTTPDAPGWGVEGYNGAVVSQVGRLKSLGANLQYLTMDEPFYFGNQWSGANAAHTDVNTLAQQAAGVIAQLKQIYPDLKVGDVEPIPYTQNLDSWFTAFEQATGTPLAFFDADLDWNTAYQGPLAQVAADLHSRGIEYGVIYNGTAADTSDAAWTNNAIVHFIAVEADPATRPDDAIFQTWNSNPTHLLGENTPGTLTNVMLTYLTYEQGSAAVSQTVSDLSASVAVNSFTGQFADYLVAPGANGGLAVQGATAAVSGSSLLTSAPVLSFSDGTVLADPSGAAGDVARLYQAAFGRAPDLAGLQYWTAQIAQGAAAETDVAQGFADSAEFSSRYGSPGNTDFVGHLYQNVLGRGADSTGQGYWAGMLDTGTSRGAVLNAMAQSEENKAATISMAGDSTDAAITRLYQAAFNRAPGQADVGYWSGVIHSGSSAAQVAADFMASAEYQQDYGSLTNSEFVVQLYLNVLHRAPDASGVQYWTDALQNSSSAAQVLVGFSNSAENRLQTAGQTHDGMVFLSN